MKKLLAVILILHVLLFALPALAQQTNKVVVVPLGVQTDCSGFIGGTAYLDNCFICVGGDTGRTECSQDCNGVWGGSAFIDNCSICVGGSTGLTACVPDCSGQWGGTAYLDNCFICVGGDTGRTECSQDCNGVWGGTAYLDNCSTCVGGNTGLTACSQDCEGVWGGTAYIDCCASCVAGSTGLTPCSQDCNGDLGGTAYIDNCSTCVGGNTGLTACVQDCEGVWGGTATCTCPSGPQTVTYGGRIWQRCDDGSMYKWDEANNYCQNLILGGYSNWRLPTKDELKSLVICDNGTPTPLADNPTSPYYCGQGNTIPYTKPTIDSQFSCRQSFYWTSTVYGVNQSWYLSFGNGGTHWGDNTTSGYNYYVRCVR